MYRILNASKDSYITNKIVSNDFRATDSNVGQASTLDLFKLYGESTLPGTSSDLIELSRLLVKFDLDPLRQLTGSFLDHTHSSFKCTLSLSHVYGGQTLPSNFDVIVFPLSKSFDEGRGRDVVSFSDLDACNWVTSSYSNSTSNIWFVTGAFKEGLLGSSDIDIISSGNLGDGNGISNLFKTQNFPIGNENLSVDVTNIISATLSSQIPDEGFLIALSGTLETNGNSYFVKRFASRHSNNVRKRPRLIVEYDDSLVDDSSNFYFDLSGSVFLNNYHKGQLSNILSGSLLTQITGLNSLNFRIESGSYSKTILGSQLAYGSNFISGVYSASFALGSSDTSVVSGTQTIKNFVEKSGSMEFKTVWSSLDNTIPYLSSSLTIKRIERNSFINDSRSFIVSIENFDYAYRSNQKVRFRVSVFDRNNSIIVRKKPLIDKSEIIQKMYYQVRDENSGDIVIPFNDDDGNNATKVSTDSQGMYFDFYMTDLDVGGLFSFDFLIKDHGSNQVYDDTGLIFRVDP